MTPQRRDVVGNPLLGRRAGGPPETGLGVAGSDPTTDLLWRDRVSRSHDLPARATAAQRDAGIDGLGR